MQAVEEPKKRVEYFFLSIDNDIYELIGKTSGKQEEAVQICINKVHQLNLSQEEPMIKLDFLVWAMLFFLIKITYFNILRASSNTYDLAVAIVVGLLCYDNSNALLDKWEKIPRLNVRHILK